MQNLILNRVSPISNLKSQQQKGSFVLFPLPFFHFETFSISLTFHDDILVIKMTP